MSLYNMLFGVNQFAPVLMAMLGVDSTQVPRFRDCYLTEDGKIAIHTRTGGGNRDYYENLDRCKANYPEMFSGTDDPPGGPWNEDMRALPGYLTDADDDFDATYATFFYEVPEKFKHLLSKVQPGEDPAKRWADTIEHLRTATPDDPQVKKLTEVMKPILDQIKS